MRARAHKRLNQSRKTRCLRKSGQEKGVGWPGKRGAASAMQMPAMRTATRRRIMRSWCTSFSLISAIAAAVSSRKPDLLLCRRTCSKVVSGLRASPICAATQAGATITRMKSNNMKIEKRNGITGQMYTAVLYRLPPATLSNYEQKVKELLKQSSLPREQQRAAGCYVADFYTCSLQNPDLCGKI